MLIPFYAQLGAEVMTFTVPNDWKAGRIWVSLLS